MDGSAWYENPILLLCALWFFWLIIKRVWRWVNSLSDKMSEKSARNREIKRQKQDLEERDLVIKEKRLKIKQLEEEIRVYKKTYGRERDIHLQKLEESLNQIKNLNN